MTREATLFYERAKAAVSFVEDLRRRRLEHILRDQILDDRDVQRAIAELIDQVPDKWQLKQLLREDQKKFKRSAKFFDYVVTSLAAISITVGGGIFATGLIAYLTVQDVSLLQATLAGVATMAIGLAASFFLGKKSVAQERFASICQSILNNVENDDRTN